MIILTTGAIKSCQFHKKADCSSCSVHWQKDRSEFCNGGSGSPTYEICRNHSHPQHSNSSQHHLAVFLGGTLHMFKDCNGKNSAQKVRKGNRRCSGYKTLSTNSSSYPRISSTIHPPLNPHIGQASERQTMEVESDCNNNQSAHLVN